MGMFTVQQRDLIHLRDDAPVRECARCAFYAWDMRIMSPVVARGVRHHPNCPLVRPPRSMPRELVADVVVAGKFTPIARAYDALRTVAPALNQSQYAILLGQAKAESDFGDAFETPDGSSSNNWGAIYTEGDRGTLTRTDYTPDGKPVTVKAAWNSSPEVGASQFYNLIRGSYAPALDRAAAGDLWGYSEALWRNGPCTWQKGACTRPSYYVGFPPGHKYGLAPAGVVQGSALDRWYRILAYARFMSGGVNAVNSALGWSSTYSIKPPAQPSNGASSPTPTPPRTGGGSGLLIAGVAALGGLAALRALR